MDEISIYAQMVRSRLFEEKVQALFKEGLMYGTTHLNIGQEASHTGVCNALDPEDWIVPTHRCHGFNVARGSSLSAMFSELLGSRHGLCKGIGGSMHMTDISTFNAGSSAVVGSGIALAAGIALYEQRRRSGKIAVAIFGDGATSRGVLHECMNIAALWNLPLLFYCENNHYGMSASAERMISTDSIASRSSGYRMKSFSVDGNDYQAVHDCVKAAREYITETNEPVFIEADTYRLCGHSKSDHCIYRSRDEEEEWKSRDPLSLFPLEEEIKRKVEKEVAAEVDAAFTAAWQSRDEILSEEELESYVYAPSEAEEVSFSGLHNSTYRLAIREALDEILSQDPSALLIGEDVGLYGGCFGVTETLYEKHPDSILETPVSEEGFTGMAVGAAAMGLHPIVELMYGDFATLASDPVINHAAKLRFMSACQLSCPLVLRLPMGSGTGHGSQHTQSLEGMFLNVPGLRIVAPSDPFTAKALLKAAVKDGNPVLFIEHKALYGVGGECGDARSSFPIGKARVLRDGTDCTLISYSHATFTCRKALSSVKSSVEHIDLCTIKPIDYETVKRSVLKTGRAILVEDVSLPGSVMASVAALLSQDEDVFCALKSPIKVISGKDVPIPFSRELEMDIVPLAEEIAKTIEMTSGSGICIRREP